MSPEMKLFRAIIQQAFTDALFVPDEAPSKAAWVARKRAKDAKKGMIRSDIDLEARWEKAIRDRLQEIENTEREQRTSRAWLLGTSRDLQMICNCAGYEIEYINRKARELQRNGWRSLGKMETAA